MISQHTATEKKKLTIAFFGDSLTDGTPGVSYIDTLKEKFPHHTLLNYGKRGDTVISLYRRIRKIPTIPHLDLAFLWVGVNDVLGRTSWRRRLIKRLRNQALARSRQEFKSFYRSLLDVLGKKADRIAAVSPLFIGEDIDNVWNRELEDLGKIIQDLSSQVSCVCCLNPRNTLLQILRPDFAPRFVREPFLTALLRIVGFKSRKLSRWTASKGWIFTIDGVHLNQTGAKLVAECFSDVILNAHKYFS